MSTTDPVAPIRTSSLRRCAAVGVVAALILAACGASDDDTESADAAEAVPSAPSNVAENVAEIDPATLDLDALSAEDAQVEVRTDPLPLDPDGVDAIAARTTTLVERFGPDGAFDALLLAVARGYSADAIATAITADTLDALGFIDDLEPTLAASTLLELPSPVQGLRTAATTTTVPPPLTVERLRLEADAFEKVSERALEPWEAPEIATGGVVAMIRMVQHLALLGLSGDQIVNAIALGFGGVENRYLQIGMAPVAARCRFVIIGGKPEPIGDDRCEDYAAKDVILRDAYLERGFPYPDCEDRSLEGIYDACAAENAATAADDTVETAEDERATSGVWTGSGSVTSSSGTEFGGSATIVLRDGVYTLTYETTQESNSDCSSFSTIESEASATPNESGRLLFTSTTERYIVSDCKFYEDKGGEDIEVAETTVTAYLLDGDQIRLDLLPGSPFVMEHTPG